LTESAYARQLGQRRTGSDCRPSYLVGSTSTQQGWDRRCVAQDSGAAGEGVVHEARGRLQTGSYPTMGHSRSVSVATILLHQRVTSLMAGAGTGKQTNRGACARVQGHAHGSCSLSLTILLNYVHTPHPPCLARAHAHNASATHKKQEADTELGTPSCWHTCLVRHATSQQLPISQHTPAPSVTHCCARARHDAVGCQRWGSRQWNGT
jgi:hypothetical protein